jgi:hypothetical protein
MKICEQRKNIYPLVYLQKYFQGQYLEKNSLLPQQFHLNNKGKQHSQSTNSKKHWLSYPTADLLSQLPGGIYAWTTPKCFTCDSEMKPWLKIIALWVYQSGFQMKFLLLFPGDGEQSYASTDSNKDRMSLQIWRASFLRMRNQSKLLKL